MSYQIKQENDIYSSRNLLTCLKCILIQACELVELSHFQPQEKKVYNSKMKPKDSYELKFQLLSPKCILSASLFRKKESLSPGSAPSESQTQEYPLPMRRLLLLHLRLKQHMETPTLPVDNRLNVFSQFGRWHNGTVSTMAQLESLLAKSNFT